MDTAGAFKAVLEQLGYLNVEIKMTEELPKHVIEWARGDDKEMTDRQVAEVIPYYKITSTQGSFGLVVGAYPMLDTKETGYSARDLGDTEATEDSFIIVYNYTTLQRLKRLLEIHK